MYVSCYFTPNKWIDIFRARMDILEDIIQTMERNIIVAGDFNSKALERARPEPDRRGE